MYKMYKINNTTKKILTFDVLCVIVKLTIKVVSLGELRLLHETLITTHLVYQCVVMTLMFDSFKRLYALAGRLRQQSLVFERAAMT